MKILLAVVGVAVVVLAGALFWLGAFSPVRVEERDMGPYPFVYMQEASTDFGRVRDITAALGARLEQAGYARRKPMQIWYPVGRGVQNQIGFLVDRSPGDDVLALGADTFYRPVPQQRCMVVRFPFRNPLSYLVGYFRVDPALRRHRAEKKYAETNAIVIHEGDYILYLQPVEPA